MYIYAKRGRRIYYFLARQWRSQLLLRSQRLVAISDVLLGGCAKSTARMPKLKTGDNCS